MARRLLVALFVGVPLLAIAPLAFAADDEPKITFTATGTPPLVCGTHASVSSLSVRIGTGIIIANLTGVAATVEIGTETLLDLAPGTGARVRLKKGQHEVRLIPDCAVLTSIDVAVVNVLTDGSPTDGPPPSGDPADPVDDPVTITMASPSPTATADPAGGPVAGGSGAADPGAGGATAGTGPGDAPAGPPAPSGSAGSARPAAGDEPAGSLESEVIDVQAIDLGGSRDPKGVRLLGVIAAICVFGVTAAIIRAIVSQRTSDMVSM